MAKDRAQKRVPPLSTIGALATPPMPSGLAVVRVSGPLSRSVLKSLFRSKKDPTEDPRRLVYGHLLDHKTESEIDNALAVYMPGPNSFTGEDIAEFQFHGSPLIVEKVLRALFSFGVSPAEPGEFSKRAFLNGKMDLVQAEAIADLISATSEQALQIASEQLKGRFSRSIQNVGEPLRDLLAEVEATIDFPEEEVDSVRSDHMVKVLKGVIQQISSLLRTYSYGHLVKDGYRVLLCGRPNVGKSSILNLLLGTKKAIVTDIAGTTRDLIEADGILGGYKFVFCDSAGITQTQDTVEQIGIELAKDRIGWADLVLLIVDASDPSETWKEVIEILRGKAKKVWMITNKVDLNPSAFDSFYCDSTVCTQNFYLSAKTAHGYESLVEALVYEVRSSISGHGDSSIVVTNERQRLCLERAETSLDRAIKNIEAKSPLEIISDDIRTGLSSLEEIVGKTYTEDILGRIFSKFCIGK